ncbi:zinc-dependent alcohol dehydrogenase [Stagnihabitans tardus]|uniref:Zinc-binding dehydrogenase n=1 Tax=Stagnihabitans tardus TaxID=2699202 RepID=A0AAE5BUS8_9RHOB|nr:zinc-binding dehydrogenase [Stagnihabitans tardus]NBZ86448.1 zinc-binding dehydrogenase [Stagnihabitans tardus]
MQVIEITGPRRAQVSEKPEPRAGGDVVKVQVLVAPMCTEWQSWRAGKAGHELGHEAVGLVVDAAQSKRLKVGDRVIAMPHWGCGTCPSCRAGEHIHCTRQRDILAETGSSCGLGGYAQYLIKPDYLLYPVPEDISTDHAAMALCALGPSFTAMQRMGVSERDTVLVSGCGAVGLGAVINARTLGARVIALEPNPTRADLARALGAETVLDPRSPDLEAQVQTLTGGFGADAAIETSNVETVPPLVIELVRARGRLAFVTWSGALPVARITGKGIDIFGCWHWNHDAQGPQMMQRIRDARPLLDRLTTHRFALSQISEAFALQETGACGKVLLYPQRDAP